jgi:hypothetical protein
MVICATTGRSHASRTAPSASRISLGSANVSRMMKSTPPSTSPSTC